MKKIVVILLAALLILGVVATGCQITRYTKYLAPIDDMKIWADDSFPPQYFLYFKSLGPNSSSKFYRYYVSRFGKTIRVVVVHVELNTLHTQMVVNFHRIIPLGSHFVPGETYTVEVNGRTNTFVAGEVSSGWPFRLR